jgi:hypothetical protein
MRPPGKTVLSADAVPIDANDIKIAAAASMMVVFMAEFPWPRRSSTAWHDILPRPRRHLNFYRAGRQVPIAVQRDEF